MGDETLMCVEPEVGLYVDDPPHLVLPHIEDLLAGVPVINRLRVMVDGPEPGLGDRRWSPPDLAELKQTVGDDIELTVTFWAAAQKAAIVGLGKDLDLMVQAAEADSVEGDLEGAGGWRRRSLVGYRSLRAAGDALAAELAGLRGDGVRIEGSTFPGHVELTEHAGFAPHCDRMNVQTYPVAWVKRKGVRRVVAWDSKLGPDRRVQRGLSRAVAALPKHVLLTTVLPAWRQRWLKPQQPPSAAMREALMSWERTRAEYPERILPVLSYWSWKWFARLEEERNNPYALRFLQALRAGA